MDTQQKIEELLRDYRTSVSNIPLDLPRDKFTVALNMVTADYAEQIMELFS